MNSISLSEEFVWKLLTEKRGYFYVCGEASRMARDVHRTLHEVGEQVTGEPSSKIEQIIKTMSDQGRYQKDIW